VPLSVREIISGGHTGAERAALDWAIERGISHGGWCLKGRLADDGVIPERYALKESSWSSRVEVAECNVIDSGATLFLSKEAFGEKAGRESRLLAKRFGKPWMSVWWFQPSAYKNVADFLRWNKPRVVYVTGATASEDPEIGETVHRVLTHAFRLLNGGHPEELLAGTNVSRAMLAESHALQQHGAWHLTAARRVGAGIEGGPTEADLHLLATNPDSECDCDCCLEIDWS
jgi:hypothetical protein